MRWSLFKRIFVSRIWRGSHDTNIDYMGHFFGKYMPFLTLEDVILHPLLSGFIALSFLSGVGAIATQGGIFFLKRSMLRVEVACSFMVLLGILGTGVHMLALGGYINSWGLRFVGYPICAIGIYYLSKYLSKGRKILNRCYMDFKVASVDSKIDLGLLGGTWILFFMCVIGPPTDADSLDYHLGFPLDMLRNNGFVQSNDWISSRLIGLGEYLNLFGLGLGSDNFGAILQFLAMCWLCLLVIEGVTDLRRNLLLLKLILSTPILLFMIPNQKPQLIGIVAIVASVILIVKRPKMEKSALILALGSLFFAMSLKYSFYLTGAGIFVFICYKARKNHQLRACIGIAAIFYIGFLFPIHLGNFINYGDPASPVLSSIFKLESYEYEVLKQLRAFQESGFSVPIGLLIPRGPGTVPTVIGIGLLIILFIGQVSNKTKEYLVLSAYCFIIVFLMGQRISRSFLEVYFLLIAAVGTCGILRSKGLKLYSGCFVGSTIRSFFFPWW